MATPSVCNWAWRLRTIDQVLLECLLILCRSWESKSLSNPFPSPLPSFHLQTRNDRRLGMRLTFVSLLVISVTHMFCTAALQLQFHSGQRPAWPDAHNASAGQVPGVPTVSPLQEPCPRIAALHKRKGIGWLENKPIGWMKILLLWQWVP